MKTDQTKVFFRYDENGTITWEDLHYTDQDQFDKVE